MFIKTDDMTARERRYIEQIRELEAELARKNELIQSYQRQLFEYQLLQTAQESPIPAPRIIMMN